MTNNTIEFASHLGEASPKRNEDEVVSSKIESNTIMMEKTRGRPRRAQHPKGHGCLDATFEVVGNLEENLRVGIFSKPRSFQALIRFSNGAKSEDDHIDGDAHGMAIKLLNVEGDKILPEEQGNDTLDIILLNDETFFEGDLEKFFIFNDLTAEIANARRNGGDRVQAVLNGVWLKVFRKLFRKDILTPALETSDQQPVSPLRAKYWSTTPYLLGDQQAIKYIAVPIPEPTLSELTEGVTGPDGLGERLRSDLAKSEAHFDFFVQVQNNLCKQPVEDPTINWTDAGAKSFLVAKIRIPKTSDLSDENWAKMQEKSEIIAFNPWNVSGEHRPLGAINRARKMVYSELLRQRRNL